LNARAALVRLRRWSGSARSRTLALAAGLAIALGIVGMGTAVEVSSRPSFCGSCHIMRPYYESWQRSTHHHVACVDCHIPPGVTAEFRKKYEALSMVARYFTGTYGTNPWTEIDDASCLRCHERRLLAGKEVFHDVVFDHTAHLAGMRRGKTLRCTSCHSQIVQGSHIAVTTTTCILCHFKGVPSGTGTARCTLCHRVPEKVIRKGTMTFHHADVARFGMDCGGCHGRPQDGDGAVPRERCVTCHNESSRLAEYGNSVLLHRKHVTEHKVDCMDCHLEIKHVATPHLDTAAAPGCGSCHEQSHSPQMSLYAGVGGRGVEALPSPMFLAGVRCEGCHFALPGQAAAVHRASDVSCMSCHGSAYRKIFLAWKQETAVRTGALEAQMRQTTTALGGRVPGTLEEARFNLDLVVRGHAIHNVDYAYALLRRSHEAMNAARGASGLGPLPLPWREAPYASPCLECHRGIESGHGSIFGRDYRHEPHVLRAKIDCILCHRPHAERARGEVVRFDASGCEACHHGDAKADCLSCHAGIRERKVRSFRGEFDHAFHLDEAGQSCADCHEVRAGQGARLKKDTCASCHAEEAPSPPATQGTDGTSAQLLRRGSGPANALRNSSLKKSDSPAEDRPALQPSARGDSARTRS
jgi:nitrate/TMAO reductase-like tetraheme cytochrome c subunit